MSRETWGLPDPKAERTPPKEKKPLKRKAISKNPKDWKNTFECSDGERVTEAEIRQRMNATYDLMAWNVQSIFCAAYGVGFFIIDHDHTIAKARCKVLHKTELIWDADNIEFSSRKAHQEWENYQNGLFMQHKNFERRMAYVKQHDPEMWAKRMEIVAAFTKPKETV